MSSSLSTLGECTTGLGSELGVGTFCVDVLNSILLNTQSIDGLYRVSQLYLRTVLQSESNRVTSPEGKQMGRLVALVIMVVVVLSNRWRTIRDTK